jgi:HPt (histidine-containing phosphotransfer) domain-containing protein
LANNDTISDSSSIRIQRPSPKSKPTWTNLRAEYIDDLPSQLKAIRAILEIKDYDKIKRHAHRIKGTSGTYGLENIAKHASELEKSAETQDSETVAAAINNLTSSIEIQSDRVISQAAASISSRERTANA